MKEVLKHWGRKSCWSTGAERGAGALRLKEGLKLWG